MFPWSWRFLPFLSLICTHGIHSTLLSTEKRVNFGPFGQSKSIPARDPRPATPESTGQAQALDRQSPPLQAFSLGFWGWGVYLVSSAAQPRLTGSPTILRGRLLFDAQLSRPATSSRFLSCGVNPPAFCCTSTTARRTANYRTSATSPQLSPAPRLTWDLHQSHRLAAVDLLTNPFVQVRSIINPGNALSLARLLHMCILRASTQATCIIANACLLFGRFVCRSATPRSLICACLTLPPSQSCLSVEPKMSREFFGLAASLTWLPLLGLRLAS